MIPLLENLKKSLFDVLQAQAGKIGQEFVSDLKFTVKGNVEFKVMDESRGDKVVFETSLPFNSGGDFK